MHIVIWWVSFLGMMVSEDWTGIDIVTWKLYFDARPMWSNNRFVQCACVIYFFFGWVRCLWKWCKTLHLFVCSLTERRTKPTFWKGFLCFFLSVIWSAFRLLKFFKLFQLQDGETTSGQSEVKFQVSRDTLGAMLRSMAYIREQLSCAVSYLLFSKYESATRTNQCVFNLETK